MTEISKLSESPTINKGYDPTWLDQALESALALYPEKMQNTSYLFRSYQINRQLQVFNDFTFSLAKLSDSAGCFILNSQLGYETEESAFSKRFLFLVAHPEHSVIVAKNNSGKIIAWMHMGLRFLIEADHFAQIAAIVVSEDQRSTGIGTHFLKVAEDWAKHHGMNQIGLSSSLVREKAHKFYLKNGFSNSKTSKAFVKNLNTI